MDTDALLQRCSTLLGTTVALHPLLDHPDLVTACGISACCCCCCTGSFPVLDNLLLLDTHHTLGWLRR
jgi:hypothetical protein